MACMHWDVDCLDALQERITQVLEAMHETKQLEYTLLAAACLVKACNDGWELDFEWTDDPFTGQIIEAWCSEKIYDARVGTLIQDRFLRTGICITVRSPSISSCQQPISTIYTLINMGKFIGQHQ